MSEAVILWIVLCGVVAYVADRRDRSAAGFFVLSFLLSPLIGAFVLLATPRGEPRTSWRKEHPDGPINITREKDQ